MAASKLANNPFPPGRRQYGIILSNSNYESLRSTLEPNKSHVMYKACDLFEAVADQKNYKDGLLGLGVQEDEIYMSTELDFPAFLKVFKQITDVV